jgi:hypothetical protein
MIWSYLAGGIPGPGAATSLDRGAGRWILPLLAALATVSLILASALGGDERPRPLVQPLSSTETSRALSDDATTRSIGAPSGPSRAR